MKLDDLNTQREIWKKVLTEIKSNPNYRTNLSSSYFDKTFINSVNGNKIIVGCESSTVACVLKTNFKDIFTSVIASVTNTNFDVVFVPLQDIATKSKEEIIKDSEPLYFKSIVLNDAFTFDKFIEGPSNKDAKKAAMIVSSNLGTKYNPFYIQGDSGLGKTHLLQAIAHQVKTLNPDKNILCISAQNFFDEYINFMKNSSQNISLTDYLKNVDVFLVDDIQQLKGKEKTLDYFFDIYSYFINNNKQIVLTSDRRQNDLEGIPDRLITRFLSGLSVVINKPDFFTCKKILLKKIEFSPLKSLDFSDEALDYISTNYSNSIRELEGIITRITFFLTINDYTGEINLPFLYDALGIHGYHVSTNSSKLDAEKIISCVANYYNVSIEQLKGKSRKNSIVLARQIAMYLIRSILDIPFDEIGSLFNNRDHSTIMHSVSKIDNLITSDNQCSKIVSILKNKLEYA